LLYLRIVAQSRFRVNTFMNHLRLFVLVVLLLTLNVPTPAAAQPAAPDFFGLNMYITGRERSDAEARALIAMAREIGVTWTREEISWAAWGAERPVDPFYDKRLGMLAEANINVIGMLLTTPEEFRDKGCEQYARSTNQPEYWCAPTDMQAYADWAARVVERFDGDGIDDAPGSPRVAVWEIWNEPDMDGTWLPRADAGAYALMLKLAYQSIKQADPTATVLSGGVYVFDGVGEAAFMDRVVELAGWNSFDAISIHPWLIDHAPDEPTLINARERFDVTIPGRIAVVQRWAEARGGGKPIWVTEVGWSVCGAACAPQFAKSEDEQATYMVRSFVLASALGVQHQSYFQLEDKFNGAQQPWGPAAIVRDDLSPRPAFYALGTLIRQLRDARYAGTGSAHRPGALAHYRYELANGSVDVLWSLNGEQRVRLPLTAGLSAELIARDGATSALNGGSAELLVGSQPLYLRQSQERAVTFAETGQTLRDPFLRYWEQNGGLAIFGFPLSAERTERGSNGRDYRVQWFERNRFEYHPENAPPNDVLLGLLGVETLARRGIDWRTLPTVDSAGPGCRYFPETRHSLCPPFRAYWEQNGGLALFGYPISEPLAENSSDGRTLTVQYFERNRFEEHPDAPPAYRVQLGRLGAELMP
jgi:hypothetical protein